MTVQANETSREELLMRDVKILYDENRKLKKVAEMAGLNCPKCGFVMVPLEENKFACYECNIAAEQTTIFQGLDEELAEAKAEQELLIENKRKTFAFFLNNHLEYIRAGAPNIKRSEIAAKLGVSYSQLWQYERGNATPRNMKLFSKRLNDLVEAVKNGEL